MEQKRRYVHLYCDVLDKLHLLAHGSNAVIYIAIGAMPEGATIETIATYTGLTKRTIEQTVETLITNGLVTEPNHGNYNAVNYIEYRKPVRETHTEDRMNLSFNQPSINLSSVVHRDKNNISLKNTAAGANFYAEYQAAFHELAQDRSAQAEANAETIGQYPAEWVREAFKRTAASELKSEEVWRQWRRVPYALRILENWQNAGGIQEEKKTVYPTKQERVERGNFQVVKKGSGFYG